MKGVQAFLRLYSTPLSVTGWRGVPLLGVAAAITVALPQARAILAAGLMGGIVIGATLIIARHQFGSSGPRRGTPIVLFPRTAELRF
jgi:hypothetical protein